MRTRPTLVAATLLLAGCRFDPVGANYLDTELPDAAVAPPADAAPIDTDARADAAPEPPDAAPLPDAAPEPDAAEVPIGCGDGVVEPPEQCDDHGSSGGDGCSAACRWEAVACYPGAQLTPLTPGVTASGSTAGQWSGLSGGATCGGAAAGEDVFTFELAERSDVMISTALPGTAFDTAVYVRSRCNEASSQLGCASQGRPGDVLALPELPAASYFVVVDGFAAAAGAYELRLTLRPVRGAEAPCDPFGEASRCSDGLACVASDGAGSGVCRATAVPTP